MEPKVIRTTEGTYIEDTSAVSAGVDSKKPHGNDQKITEYFRNYRSITDELIGNDSNEA